MAKVKRMMLGGAANAVARAVKSAVPKAPPSQAALQKAIPNPMTAAPAAANAAKTRAQAGAQMQAQRAMSQPAPSAGAGLAGMAAGRTPLASPTVRAGMASQGRSLMKKGGAVKKKATKK